MEDQICKTFYVGEETYAFATSIFGTCSPACKLHVFCVEADLVSPKLWAKFHKRSKGKLYAANYQMTAAIKKMGLGGSAMETLSGFVEFPCSGLVQKHLTKV